MEVKIYHKIRKNSSISSYRLTPLWVSFYFERETLTELYYLNGMKTAFGTSDRNQGFHMSKLHVKKGQK